MFINTTLGKPGLHFLKPYKMVNKSLNFKATLHFTRKHKIIINE